MKKKIVAGALFGAVLTLSPVFAADPGSGLPEVDPSVDPCTNFYQYACSAWTKSHPIPSDQSRWGSFSVLNQSNQEILRAALEKVIAEPKPGSQRLADFYGACMDDKAADSKGWAPIKPTLDKVAALSDLKSLAKLLADLHAQGINAYFAFGSQTDFEDARKDIAAVQQAGLGLPNRDFYVRESDKDENRRKEYVSHIARMFQLIGEPAETAQAKAETVMRIETGLAKSSLTLAELNDPQLTNHKKPTADLSTLLPDFDWTGYFAALSAPQVKSLNIAEPDFLKAVQTSFAAEPIDDIKVYLTWHVLHARAAWLSKPFADENFAFYGKVLTGAQELRPRWKRCVALTDDSLGEDLGRYYVEAAFGPEHKKRMLQMVKELKAAYDSDIDTLVWMGPKTKQKAHEKLAAIIDKIGYPDHWRDYSKLVVKGDDLIGDIERTARFDSERDVHKIGKPHDKTEWEMTPPTVNAYYDPTENDINFPAGILQPPFFTMTADDAVNYGAIGMVIGHEMTHGFDDQGRQYDKDGNLKDWWTKEDAKKFEERAACVVDQYGSYTAIDDVKQNGKATLGENLADNGGIRIALAALKKHLAGSPDRSIGGFTAEQRFFLGFAQVWCTNARDDAIRTQAMSDVHSLPEFRVNGTVSNSEDFARAFACKADAPMVRGAKACRVW
jgi:endothelin-converting enzyme/putative endopeptidase